MKNVEIVTALSMMRGLGFSSIWIFSALYLRKVLGLSVLVDGLILTIGSSVAAVVQIYGGILSDRFGYKRTVVVSLFGALILYAILVTFPIARGSSLVYPLVFVLLMIANTAQAPAMNAIISASSDVKLKGFSILRIGNNIGWGIGPAIGGFLVYAQSFYYLFLFGLAAAVGAFALSLLIRDVKARGSATLPMASSNRLLIALSFVALLLFIVQAQETVTLSNYANIVRNLNYFEIGILYLTNGIAVILTQGFVYRISAKIGNYHSFILGAILYSFGFFSFSLFSSLSGMMLSTVIFTFGEDFAFPAGYTMVSLVSKPENLGRNMGTYNAFISAGRAIGPLLGGFVMSLTTSAVEIWGLTTMSGFISVVLFVAVFHGKNRVYSQESATVEGGN